MTVEAGTGAILPNLQESEEGNYLTHDKSVKSWMTTVDHKRIGLMYLAATSTTPEKLRVSKDFFSFEPYALAMKRGDDEFRLVVDTAISRIYRTGAIVPIFRNSFGAAEPSEVLRSLYLINGLPE